MMASIKRASAYIEGSRLPPREYPINVLEQISVAKGDVDWLREQSPVHRHPQHRCHFPMARGRPADVGADVLCKSSRVINI